MSRPGGAVVPTAELTSEPVQILITASFAADREDELNVDNSDRSTLDASRCSPRKNMGGGTCCAIGPGARSYAGVWPWSKLYEIALLLDRRVKSLVVVTYCTR